MRVHAQNAGSDDAKESAHALKLWGTPGEVRMMAAEPSMKLKVSLQRGGRKHRKRESSIIAANADVKL